MNRIWAVLTAFLCAMPVAASASDDSDGDKPYHHLAGFVGLGAETKRDKLDENGFVGAMYELQFHKNWGIGGVLEGLGQNTVRDVIVVVPVTIHPGGKWKVFAGPGVEFLEKKEKFLFRFGGAYKFPIGGHWSLAPEVFTDFVDGGAITIVGGVAIGYKF